MKDDKGFTLALSWIVGGAAALWICYMLGAFLGVSRNEAPAWVQAVGSIMAICAAIVISSWQHRAEKERRFASDIRRLKAIKAVLVQIHNLATVIQTAIKHNNIHEIYNFDPQFLLDYKVVLQAFPLLDVPIPAVVIYLNTIPRAIDEVTSRLLKARNQMNDPMYRFEWLLANDIEHRADNLFNVTMIANDFCFVEIEKLGGWTEQELAESKDFDKKQAASPA